MISWEKIKLGDISEMCLGKMLDKKKNKGEFQPYLANINVRWGNFDFSNLSQMRFEEKESERYGLKYGDLIICEGGEPGRCALWKDEVPEMKIQKALHRVRIHDSHSKDFIYYRFLLAKETGELEKHFIGSTIKHLTGIGLKEVEFSFPDFTNQQKIAAVLSALDAKIELNNKINGELEAMAKLLYDYWFVQFDFPISAEQAAAMGKPELEGQPYQSSGGKMTHNKSLNRIIPEGWEAGTAASLFNFNPTESLKGVTEANHFDMARIHTSGFMTSFPYRKKVSGGTKCRNGDIVVARITPCLENGKTGLISLLNESEIATGSTEFIVMRGRIQSLKAFGICLARSPYFRKFAILNMTGTSGRKRIEAPILETISLPIPPSGLLTKFEETFSASLLTLTANQKQNQHLASLRDWLLPMLMNGQVTVK